MRRSVVRAVQGMVMAFGAPLGWLLLQVVRGSEASAQLSAHTGLYVYMLVATFFVFGLFGTLLGTREDRLLRLNRDLAQVAITDSLTGLRNARYFHARFAEEHAEWVRTGRPLALVIMDIDHFKRVNDEYGHQVGDDVLETTAHAISAVTRQGETEARVGGEEFALLLPGSDGQRAREAAERARRAIADAATSLAGGGAIRVTASAGVASTAELPDAGVHALYQAADTALYAAKSGGRNRTVVAEPGDGTPVDAEAAGRRYGREPAG